MNFKNEMQNYFKLRTLDERTKKILDIIYRLEMRQDKDDSTANLNMVEAIIEYCLLIDDNDERLQQYDRALELVNKARHSLKKKNHVRQLLRSYHLECFIKFYTLKYKDEENSIHDIFNLSGKIIEIVTQTQKENLKIDLKDYYSLGCVWHAYGLILDFINKLRELKLSEKRDRLEKASELAHKGVELSKDTSNRDAHILSAYFFAFIEEFPQRILQGDKASTEDDFIAYTYPFEVLLEVARAHDSIEFEYLALLNQVRLKVHCIIYAAGVSERKTILFNEALQDCKKLEAYESIIRLPHFRFYKYQVQTAIYTSIVYFEAVQEKKFNYYIDKALRSAEEMKEIYVSSGMTSVREKLTMHHILNDVYRMKASHPASQKEKLEYLKRSEELLLEDEKTSAAWSYQVYSTWRDLSSIYFDLSKVERNKTYFKKCVSYTKKAYNSALETNEFKDALFEAYKTAIIAEDYQEYSLSMTYYELALKLIDKIIQSGKDYPYYHNLKTYLNAQLMGVKAKEEHRVGNYTQAMVLYRKASSLLQSHAGYSYEALLYNAYALFEEASLSFIEEKYKDTLQILFNINHLFDETKKHHDEDYEPQFQYFIDRRAYDLLKLFFESSKAFCIAQSNILQSLIYRNTGSSERAVELLKEANVSLSQFTDRNVHIAGYYAFANGLYGLEQSELEIREGEYRKAASYLASASDQFGNASQILASDERLSQLCEGLNFFCQGWMYALEIMRRHRDLSSTELNTNFNLASKSFTKATRHLKIFEKTFNGVSGFEKLLNYIYYSLIFEKTDDSAEKSEFKDKMVFVLNQALKYFKNAEDMERYRFTRDLISTLPQLKDLQENVFKPINIPFTPYTPVFDTTSKIEPSGVHFVVSLDKTQVEVNEKIRYVIQISSDVHVKLQKIEGILPKMGIKVVSGTRFVKNGMVKIDRSLVPGHSILIEFTIRGSMPLHSRKHPQLIYFTLKNERFRTFSAPITIQIFPKNLLRTGVVNKITEKVNQVLNIIDELGITVGEFPIVYHNLNSYRKTLSEYFVYNEINGNKNKGRSKKPIISKLPIQQMAFVDPLGDVNILYDMEKYLYLQSIVSLLSIIIHEKFGHGFFYQHTTLGKRFLELEYHRKGLELLMQELKKVSNKYAVGLQWLAMSTSVVNEGFAIWLTLKTFEKMLKKNSKNDQQFFLEIRQEIERIKEVVFSNQDLDVNHEYFAQKYGTPNVNPYKVGYDLFFQIEEKFGEKCVPEALKIVADFTLTRRQISRMKQTVKNDKHCIDMRLNIIASSQLEMERNNVNLFKNAAMELLL